MNKEMFISSSPHETKVAVCEDGQLVEVYFERDTDVGLVGGIYKGRVSRVLPGMQSAFVDIGLERDAFLYVSDFSLQDQEDLEGALNEAQARRAAIEIETQADSGALAATGETIAESADTAPETRQQAPSLEAVGHPDREPAATTPPAEASAVEGPKTHDAPRNFRPGGEEGGRHRPRRGRRRRHGRGGFGEQRFPSRHEHPAATEKPEVAPASSFEVLPGESLAKYRHASPGSPASVDVNGPSESKFIDSMESTAPGSSASIAETHKTEEQAAKEIGRPENFEHQSEEFHQESNLNLSPFADSGSEASFAPSAVEESPTGAEGTSASAGPDADAEFTSTQLKSSDEDSAQSEDPAKAALGESTEEPAPEGETEEKTPAPTEGNAPSAERSYTLREPHAHPRFAPRRNRRGRRRIGRHSRRNNTEPSQPDGQQGMQIAELLKEGQEIIVQIAKEPLGTKGARITSHIALPGRYLVYMPTISHIGVSRKIASEQERLRLRNIILENRGSLTGGFILRTAGEGRSEEEIKADLKFLTTLWNDVRGRAERSKAPALLYRDLDLAQRLLRDLLTADFKSVWIDNEADYERVVDFVNHLQSSLIGKVKLHTRETALFEEHGLQAELEKALRPKVWLKSGGYIVINQTEALVAIDVNTGKYVGKTNRLEDTIVKTNIDAVNEIVRQIRLRDLGGIIVIDFIDMDERRNRNKVVQALEEALGRDRAPTKVLSFNDFGLVAVTRKRVKQSLERTLCDPCTYCSGSGWVKSVTTVCYEILAEARKMAREIDGKTMTLRVNPEVAQALKSKDGTMISEIESLTHKDVVVKSDPAIHQERFEIF